MSDIVDRLRHCSENCGDDYLHELAGRAAAEIERLRTAMATIRAETLEEAANVADRYEIPLCETSASHIAAAIRALKGGT